MQERFTWWAVLTSMALSLSGCFPDFAVDEASHPCAQCRDCEVCAVVDDQATCFPLAVEANPACDSDGNLVYVDSCGENPVFAMQCDSPHICSAEREGCVCPNHWAGELCEACPPEFDPAADCNACRNHWTGENCDLCPPGFERFACNSCRNHWRGENCDECPGNFDPDQDCNACRNHWTGQDCSECPAGYTEESDCTECAPHWTSTCFRCAGYWDIRTDCETCLPGYVDEDNDCGSCALGYEPLGGRCEEDCGNGIITAGEDCDDANAAVGDGCEDCRYYPMQVATGGTEVDVASAPDGRFVVAFEHSGIRLRLYDAEGFAVTDAWEPAAAVGYEHHLRVAMHPDGSFVAAWQRGGYLLLQHYQSDGTAPQPAITVDTGTSGAPTIIVTPDGGFATGYRKGSFYLVRTYADDGTLLQTDSNPDVAASNLEWSDGGPVYATVREVSGPATIVDKVWLIPGGLVDPTLPSDYAESEPMLTLDASGHLVAVWKVLRGGDTSWTGAFGGAVQALPKGVPARDGGAALVGLDVEGRFAMAGAGTRPWYAMFDAAQTTPVESHRLDDDAYAVAIAPRPGGEAVLVWTTATGTYASLLDAGGTAYPPRRP